MNKTLRRILNGAGSLARDIIEYLREAHEMNAEVCFSATFGARPGRGYYKKQSVYNTFARLHRQGYLKREKRAGKVFYKLPEVVRKELQVFDRLSLRHRSSASWDRRWRLVSFDIPETQRKYRDTLRWKLKRLGLKQFQQSIWVTPYPLEDNFQQIIVEGGLQNCVLIIDTDRIPNASKWKRHFRLIRNP